MVVSSTDVQNNFGKYLELCRREQVIITKNGVRRALLAALSDEGTEEQPGYEVRQPVPAYAADPSAGGPRLRRAASRMRYQEFVQLTESSDERFELIDGEVYLLATPVFRHQAALGRLHVLLHEYLGNQEGCTAVFAPFDIRLTRESVRRMRETDEDDLNVVQPDLVVICDYRKDLNEKDQYWGVPQLAVEILSPSTRSKDSIRKVDLYMDSGVAECWLVDPQNRSITLHIFRDHDLAETRLATVGCPAESARFPGLRVEVERILEIEGGAGG